MSDGRGIAALLLVGVLIAGSTGLAAQDLPQQTTATYGDWTLRCNAKPGSPPQRTCQIVQVARAQNQANPITQIIIVRPAKDAGLKGIIQVPINVWLPSGIRATF